MLHRKRTQGFLSFSAKTMRRMQKRRRIRQKEKQPVEEEMVKNFALGAGASERQSLPIGGGSRLPSFETHSS